MRTKQVRARRLTAALGIAAASTVARLAAAAPAPAHDDRDGRDSEHKHRQYAIGLWGDLPYSDLQAQVGVPNLIADMNSQANGTNDVNWLKVLVDPDSREVFQYEAQIVPANRVAVPAP
jgi:hypothetical protein